MTCLCPTCGSELPADGVFIDPLAGIVIRNGQSRKVKRKASQVLHMLWKRYPNPVSWDAIITELWNLDEPDDPKQNIQIAISQSRRIIDELGIEVRSVHRVGYRLVLREVKAPPKLQIVA